MPYFWSENDLCNDTTEKQDTQDVKTGKDDGKQQRYWLPEEHSRYLEGLFIYEKTQLAKISEHVGTKTVE